MPARRVALPLICLIAVVHGFAYLIHQQPDWNVSWTDQGGYKMLGHGIAESGEFTRYPGTTPFVAEAIRTPGYPMFVAAVYRIAGESHTAVAIAQILVFTLLCLVVFDLARRLLPERQAIAAALLTAVYAPLPYFAALVLTELWTTFALVVTIAATWRAIHSGRIVWYVVAGILYAYTALCRPVFVLLPVFMIGAGLLLFCRAANWRRETLKWAALAAAVAVTLAPWFAYNKRHFDVIGISPVGIGRPIFESSWQGIWPGRLQAQLTDTAASALSDRDLAIEVRRIAAEQSLDPEPMLRYVTQWREIRKIWETPTDPQQRALARIIGQNEYLRVGLENIRRDLSGFLKRRVVRGQFVLWAAEIPVRHSEINSLPTIVIRLIWLPQVVLFGLACAGAIALVVTRQWTAALLLITPLVYVGSVHFVMLTESRQSLPVKPLLLILAVAGGQALIDRARHART